MRRRKVLLVVGTRPEAIKLAPVWFALSRSKILAPLLCSTGQHRSMLARALHDFGLKPDVDLDLMSPDQSLEDLTARLLPPLAATLRKLGPAAVLVQGDTTTTFVGALAAFYAGIPCGHVEAGLRTYDFRNPFPEEMNRRLADHLCEWHFVPTALGRSQLRKEGIPARRITVTGNTVVDALLWMRQKGVVNWPAGLPAMAPERLMLLVTTHRREAFGEPMRRLFQALKALVRRLPEVEIVFPVHLNPHVREAVDQELRGVERIHLIEPVSYPELISLMDRCHLILTDSGGIQEEAPTLGKPVLVLRKATERPEGILQGTSILTGTDPDRVVRVVTRLLTNPGLYRRMSLKKNPYGDGRAAGRIVARLEAALGKI